MALSPWPKSGAHLTAARTLLKESIALFENTNPDISPDELYDRLGCASAALVERYASGAPQPIRNEAVIRCAGYLAQSSPSQSQVSEETGNWKRSNTRTGLSALRHSGAMAILSPWKVRRAGRIA